MTPQSTQLFSKFDEEKTLAMIEDGESSVSGSALIRQKGGGIVTCAGNVVDLVPATEYASERMEAVYGSNVDGYVSRKNFSFYPNPIEYFGYRKRTTCDSQGNFKFKNVVSGVFFIETKVTWRVGNNPQGGWLMKKISIAENSQEKVVIAP